MKKNISMLVIFISLILFSCKDNITNIYNSKPGNIQGKVSIFYDYGIDSTYNGGVNIWIPGTNYRTISDSAGYWSLDSVPQGIYDIYFYKDGCDTTQDYAFQFVGNGNIYYGSNIIYEIPKAEIKLDSVYCYNDSESFSTTIIISGRTNKDTKIAFYFDTLEIVSKYNNIQNISLTLTNQDTFKLFEYIYSYTGITAGQMVYICAYPGEEVQNIDYRTGKSRIIGLGKQSNVLSFIYK